MGAAPGAQCQKGGQAARRKAAPPGAQRQAGPRGRGGSAARRPGSFRRRNDWRTSSLARIGRCPLPLDVLSGSCETYAVPDDALVVDTTVPSPPGST